MELHDAQDVQLSAASELSYLHGGYGEMLAALERALEGKGPGESVLVPLEPEQAFGDYDAELLRVEPLERYGQMLDALERAVEGKGAGESVLVQLEPEQAFGEYDAELVRVEPASRYGEGVAVGMAIEDEATLYTVTGVADGKVVLDANHPLAGMALRFSCVILSIRAATEEELKRGVSLP